MTAPCIIRLDTAIADSADGLERARLLAEKACYLARTGEHADAEAIRHALRQSFGDARDLKVSVRVMLLEGLQSYYRSLGRDARDRLLRAQLLSRAAGHRELTAITSAWLGHVQFNEGETAEAIDNLHLATEMIDTGQWATLGRISAVLGDIFMSVGQAAAARRWYAHARQAAVSDGDQATLGAIAYNQAAFRVFDLQLSRALGLAPDPAALALAESEIRSACNFRQAAGVTALGYLLTSLQISVDVLSNRHAAALEQWAGLLQAGEIPDRYPYRAVLQADAVWCGAALGRHAQARAQASALLATDVDSLPLDDRILVYASLNRAVQQAPSLLDGLYLPVDLTALGAQFFEARAGWVARLAPFNEIPSALRWPLNEH